MATAVLRKEEGFGLILALVAHAGLIAWLALRPPMPEPLPLPETMTVTLSDDVGPVSTAPEPAAQPSPDIAPTLGEAPPSPEPVASPEPVPKPTAAPKTAAPPKKTVTPPKPPVVPPKPNKPQTGKTGGTKLGDDFLKGVPNAPATGTSPYLPANQIGSDVRSSLASAISRELKPRWVAPQGAEAEKLVTILAWDLNPDGTLAGSPRVVRQETTDANRAQAARHAEQAIRAVRLAAPFDLPTQYYNAWKHIAAFRFDKRLSQ